MRKYKKMYLILFQGITNALTEAEKMNFGCVCDILKQAQIDSEEYYIACVQTQQRKSIKIRKNA